jgi:hypothetical protein
MKKLVWAIPVVAFFVLICGSCAKRWSLLARSLSEIKLLNFSFLVLRALRVEIWSLDPDLPAQEVF